MPMYKYKVGQGAPGPNVPTPALSPFSVALMLFAARDLLYSMKIMIVRS